MLARQRQELILEQVQRDGGVRVTDLVALLGVSDMTVRRDIAALARRGLVQRVHGGATDVGGRSAEEPLFTVKLAMHPEQKAAIARAAAAFVRAGDSVAISAGTTTYAVAQELRAIPRLTVVTNSLPAADLLSPAGRSRGDLSVVLVGGVRTPSDALVGPVAEAALGMLHVDWLFLGVHGIDDRAGLTAPNLEEAATDRALVHSARQVVLTGDSSKWGVVGLSSIVPLSRVDVFVTDNGLPAEAQRAARSKVGRLVVAPVEPGDRALVALPQVRA